MKKQISLLFAILCFVNLQLFSQAIDTTATQQSTRLQKLNETLKQQGTQIQKLDSSVKIATANIDTLKNNSKQALPSDSCKTCHIDALGWILVLSPIIIFLIALLAIRKRLKDFSLKDALTESELPKITKANDAYTIQNIQALAANPATLPILNTILPPTIEISGNDYPKSSSRYLAFITSALTWILAICLCCFFIYEYIRTGKAPELSGLSTVLITLGIGVVPYAFNKISAAIK